MSASALQPTIEPELLTKTPRRIRWSASTRMDWYKLVAHLTALLTVVMLFEQSYKPYPVPFILLSVFVGIQLLLVLVSIHKTQRQAAFLKKAIPATATITQESLVAVHGEGLSEKDELRFTYQFEKEGTIITESEILSRRQAWLLGLEKGMTFTVLYNPDLYAPDLPYHHVPYFLCNRVEVVGSTGAKIIHP